MPNRTFAREWSYGGRRRKKDMPDPACSTCLINHPNIVRPARHRRGNLLLCWMHAQEIDALTYQTGKLP